MKKKWIESFKMAQPQLKSSARPAAQVYFLGQSDSHFVEELIQSKAPAWQKQILSSQDRELIYFISSEGPYWIFKPNPLADRSHTLELADSEYSWSRDSLGTLLPQLKAHQVKEAHVHFRGTSAAQDLGALVGMQISSYSFKDQVAGRPSEFPQVYFKKSLAPLEKNIFKQALHLAEAVNLARHLVNGAPNEVFPMSFAKYLKNLKWSKNSKVEIWDHRRLKKEKMGLHLGVGMGSENHPCLVHIKYRPSKKNKSKPIAFVGKGVTFDTGGLDIKPSSGMRLMKKDMGGAAAVSAVAKWVDESSYPLACDFYLALAENSVDANSMRPGDILVARNGLRVEIDNTDAEGRLVLADAIDVALSQAKGDQPEILINVATLTGAIKVALGAEVAGLFSNNDRLATELIQAAQKSGDYVWRMPLVEKYSASLASHFADCKNSSEGFGGAITAALFLQKFVRGCPWAHLDIYAWSDKGQGGLQGGMANGQSVQLLITYLKQRSLIAK